MGWLEHIRTDASERVMNDVTLTSRNMDNTVAHAGKYRTLMHWYRTRAHPC